MARSPLARIVTPDTLATDFMIEPSGLITISSSDSTWSTASPRLRDTPLMTRTVRMGSDGRLFPRPRTSRSATTGRTASLYVMATPEPTVFSRPRATLNSSRTDWAGMQ
jgi:hypothetical protein